jgi:hypothetical protein
MDSLNVLVKVVMKLRVPLNAGKFLTGGKSVIFPRLNLPHGVSVYASQPADIPFVRYYSYKINH